MFHRARLRSGGWSSATLFDQESLGGDFEPIPIVSAGSSNNVYLGWNHFFATPNELRLAHYNGAWGSPETFSTDATGVSSRWGSLVVDVSEVGHLVWSGGKGQIYYSSLGTAAPTPTPTATGTPTNTPTSTYTPTPTLTPTVTPNAAGWIWGVARCDLDSEFVYQGDTRFIIRYQSNPPSNVPRND